MKNLDQAAFQTVDEAHNQWTQFLVYRAGVRDDQTPTMTETNLELADAAWRTWTGVDGAVRAALEASWGFRLTPAEYAREIDLAATAGFWATLAQSYTSIGEEKLAGVCAQASKTSAQELSGEKLSQLDAIILDATGATLDDLKDIALDVSDALPKDPRVTIGIGAAVAVAVALLYLTR